MLSKVLSTRKFCSKLCQQLLEVGGWGGGGGLEELQCHHHHSHPFPKWCTLHPALLLVSSGQLDSFLASDWWRQQWGILLGEVCQQSFQYWGRSWKLVLINVIYNGHTIFPNQRRFGKVCLCLYLMSTIFPVFRSLSWSLLDLRPFLDLLNDPTLVPLPLSCGQIGTK